MGKLGSRLLRSALVLTILLIVVFVSTTGSYMLPLGQKTLTTPLSDHGYDGLTARMTAGTALVFGDVCYIGSDGKLELADADNTTYMPIVAMAVATISENASGVVLFSGLVRDDSWTWTAGGLLYGSTTAGEMTQTAPNGAGDQVQSIGVAVSGNVTQFMPNLILVEVS